MRSSTRCAICRDLPRFPHIHDHCSSLLTLAPSNVVVQVPSSRATLYKLQTVQAVLPLLSSSAEEVQEAAARAVEKLSRMPAAAVAVRRAEGIPLLIDLMSSRDEEVQLAAISAVMNVAHSDPKAAASIRDADGLRPLVTFLTAANVQIQIAACTALLGCSKNEANKTLIRELGAIDLLLKMLPFTNARDAQAAAVACLAFLTLNEDDARILLRLQGGMRKLQALLYANDPILQSHAAEVFAHCAPNKDSRIAMRLADCLAPLVGLLSSPHAAARTAAAGALMQGTQATRTNQVKCRELGAIAPLLRLLEPPEEGPPDREAQRRGVWTLSNIACEPQAAKQLRQSPSGFAPLILLIAGGDPILQRPASACLFNASANDLGAPTAIENTDGLPALVSALAYADTDEHHEIVASSAGVLLNCAAQAGMANTIVDTQPSVLSRLFACVKLTEHVPQVANAIGALMNITAESHVAVDTMISGATHLNLLFSVLPSMREEASVRTISPDLPRFRDAPCLTVSLRVCAPLGLRCAATWPDASPTCASTSPAANSSHRSPACAISSKLSRHPRTTPRAARAAWPS